MCKVKQVVIIMCVINFPAVVFALGTENFGDKPVEPSADWPAGMAAMVDSAGRVYSRWVNGGEYFCYKGDVKAFNNALKKFAAIEAPAHKVTIEYEYGKTNSFDSKEIWFNWRLDITGGISRSSLIEKGATEKELAPKLTYYLGRDNTKLDDIIFPNNIEVVLSDPKYRESLGYRLEQAIKWRTARCRWAEFAESFLKTQRERLKETWPAGSEPPIGGYVEFQSRLVSKYLPDYKIYIIETSVGGISNLFTVSATGDIFDLKGDDFSKKDGNEPFRNEAFSKFIASQHIRVSDVNSAVEVGKFVEELSSASAWWMYLRYNSNDFRVFKEWIFSRNGITEDPNWQWYAERCDNGWVVSRRYIGPPASIIKPPRWEITVDKDNQLVEICYR